jgi:hypothetical protein
MGNYIYHVLFDTYRVDIPQPTYYETSVAWELFKYIIVVIGAIIIALFRLARWN